MKKNRSVIFMAGFLVVGLYALLFGVLTMCITGLLSPLVAYLGLPILPYKVVAGTSMAIVLMIGLINVFHKTTNK